MFQALRHWWRRSQPALDPAPEEPPPWALKLLERMEQLENPSWMPELLESLTKGSRAQSRLALKVEDVDHKLEGGFADLRGLVTALQKQAGSPTHAPDELLDALDALDEAIQHAFMDLALLQGLQGVALRLESYLKKSGLTRHAQVGGEPDGRLFKVVGAAPSPDLAPGVITRVVRAAVTRGNQVVREGSVLTNRSSA